MGREGIIMFLDVIVMTEFGINHVMVQNGKLSASKERVEMLEPVN